MPNYATQAELEAVERRVQVLEDKIDSLIDALKRWSWTQSQDGHAHPMMLVIGGGSRNDRPLLGYDTDRKAGPCLYCGEPASEHGCPGVK